MTDAPRVPRIAFSDLDEAVAALRERGLRLTTPRRLVLEALFAADDPVSAEVVASQTGVDIASVYRNLEALEAHGVVQHVHLGHGPGLHTLVGPGEREYLYCERCRAVRCVRPDELDPVREQIRERFGYETWFSHFAIAGVCADCVRADAAAPRGRPDPPR
jgi:Fur family transcriptional regulator, ferric uptake regulator